MKINSVDNNTNFGWRYKTHEKITAMVVDEFPDLKKYKSVLTKMVVMPDFDERGFKGNNHFIILRSCADPVKVLWILQAIIMPLQDMSSMFILLKNLR